MTTNNDALLPCPFCGKEPPDDLVDTLYPSGTYWREHKGGYRSYHSHKERQPGDKQCWQIVCAKIYGGCCAEMHADSQEEVIQKWNCRTLAASKPEPQAQAGEPQDYAFGCNKEAKYGRQCCEKWRGRMECPTNDPIKAHADEYFRRHQFPSEGYDYNGKHAEPAYTLRSGFLAGYEKCRQSHREVMANLYQSNSEYAGLVSEMSEAIAKKDAALKACVEALKMTQKELEEQWKVFQQEYGPSPLPNGEFCRGLKEAIENDLLSVQPIIQIRAAIKRAQEAQK